MIHFISLQVQPLLHMSRFKIELLLLLFLANVHTAVPKCTRAQPTKLPGRRIHHQKIQTQVNISKPQIKARISITKLNFRAKKIDLEILWTFPQFLLWFSRQNWFFSFFGAKFKPPGFWLKFPLSSNYNFMFTARQSVAAKNLLLDWVLEKLWK